VLWGEDWHEGVIGIVASRLVERFNRPVVMIAGTGGEGREAQWKGSGRSVSAFDLHGALGACSRHLERFGGHRAAAGLSIAPENLEDFAAAFAAHAEASLGDDDLLPVTRIDAIVPGASLTLGLAQELERLAPFGLGNPDVTLLVPSCEAVSPNVVGEGKHLRFRVRQHGRDAGSAIAFGLGGQLERLSRPGGSAPRYDLVCRLKENRWNGTVAPQLLVRRLFDAPAGYDELRDQLAELWRGERAAWTPAAHAVFAELELEAGARRQLYESDAFRALLGGVALELPRAA
jgi:single-stranded-DNA-specific exonuclease